MTEPFHPSGQSMPSREDIDRMAGGSFDQLRERYIERQVAAVDDEFRALVQGEHGDE